MRFGPDRSRVRSSGLQRPPTPPGPRPWTVFARLYLRPNDELEMRRRWGRGRGRGLKRDEGGGGERWCVCAWEGGIQKEWACSCSNHRLIRSSFSLILLVFCVCVCVCVRSHLVFLCLRSAGWCANAEEALTPISVAERPLGERPSPETGGTLLSACQSYFPDRSHTYFILASFTVPYWFLKHRVAPRMKGPLL